MSRGQERNPTAPCPPLLGRPPSAPPVRRVSTGVRFDPALHEALKETAQELGVGVNWLVNKLCEEGLGRETWARE